MTIESHRERQYQIQKSLGTQGIVGSYSNRRTCPGDAHRSSPSLTLRLLAFRTCLNGQIHQVYGTFIPSPPGCWT